MGEDRRSLLAYVTIDPCIVLGCVHEYGHRGTHEEGTHENVIEPDAQCPEHGCARHRCDPSH